MLAPTIIRPAYFSLGKLVLWETPPPPSFCKAKCHLPRSLRDGGGFKISNRSEAPLNFPFSIINYQLKKLTFRQLFLHPSALGLVFNYLALGEGFFYVYNSLV